ncbi:MAG TPA: FG-GAP-like repeat-containing protein, partial [Rhodothermales bacterium]|nr:FG-GAP-like repeat-containing protein [Rhodothermales bacterium]
MLAACSQQSDLPDPSSEAYRETVSSFYIGLSAMQVGEDARAEAALLQATDYAPDEPAPWANLALLALRRGDTDVATERLAQARTLAPENSQVLLLSGLLALYQDDLEAAKGYLQQAIAADATDHRARYALANLAEQEGDLDAAAEQIDRLRALVPDNLAVLHAQARLVARRGDAAALAQTTARLDSVSAGWPADIQEALATVQTVSDPLQAVGPLAILRNVLLSLPAYRRDLAAIEVPAELIADPIEQFVRLPSPRAHPAPPDNDLAFEEQPLATTDTTTWDWLGVISLTGEGAPSVFVADGQQVHMLNGEALPFPGGASAQSPSQQSIVPLDYNYDFLMDLALAGAGGLRLYQQDSTTIGTFAEVTALTALPVAITDASYFGGWAADLDLEGDVDLMLATPDGPPRVLRNNGDGTFQTEPLFQDVTALRDFAWADFDADGDPDAALLDASGTLHVFANDRQNRFRRIDPAVDNQLLALAAADIDNNSIIDLVLLRADGILHQLTYQPAEVEWTRQDLARWAELPTDVAPGTVRLFVGDIDNNGGFDLLASGTSGTTAWLHDEAGAYHTLAASLSLQLFDLAALAGETRLDLLGLTATGQ